MPAAGVRALGWGYRHPGRANWAIRDASFQLEPGSLTVVVGASGSGKSTLLAGLAGVLGQGEVTGQLVVGAGLTGLVSQEPESNIVMETVGDDVAFGLENRAIPAPAIWPRTAASLHEVGLAGVGLTRQSAQLSGGQTQLLALAAATAPRPGLLLLDEPTANLDPASADEVVTCVAALRSAGGATVVVVEHRVAAWMPWADNVLVVRPPDPAGASGRPQVVAIPPGKLPELLGADPTLAAGVWVGRPELAAAVPVHPAGPAVLVGTGLQVAGRLPGAVDITVHAGEVVALMGPPGSGKSTLLGALSGLLAPTAGSVEIRADGPDTGALARRDPWQWPAREVGSTFGVVFQNPEHQFLAGRVVDELQHGLTVAGITGPQAQSRVAAMLAMLRLEHLAQANPFTLSGGEQRRLSVGTALILRPDLLVLDEPTFGQDPATWAAIVRIIAAHRDAGGAVILATHDPDLVRVLGATEHRMGDVPRAGPAGPDAGETLLRRLNPLVLLVFATIASVAALASRSPITNLALAAMALVVALVTRVPRGRLAVLAVPALVAAVSVALSNALLAPGGLTDPENWAAAALPATRVLAVALPGIITAVALDPTALADALTQQLRVPARVAYSVLAGLRLLPLLSAEWVVLAQASRARGMAASGILGRARESVSLSFRLLVAALRRGGRLAVALDSRGLGPGPRTVARPQRVAVGDIAALVATLAFVAVALSLG